MMRPAYGRQRIDALMVSCSKGMSEEPASACLFDRRHIEFELLRAAQDGDLHRAIDTRDAPSVRCKPSMLSMLRPFTSTMRSPVRNQPSAAGLPLTTSITCVRRLPPSD